MWIKIGETAKLQLSDLYLDDAYPRMLVWGKGSKQRVVYLSPQAEHILREYLSIRPSSTSKRVFLSYQLKGLSTHAIHMRLVHYRKQAASI